MVKFSQLSTFTNGNTFRIVIVKTIEPAYNVQNSKGMFSHAEV